MARVLPVRNPTHRTTLYLPNGSAVEVATCYPVKRLAIRRYCKYCCRTHRRWHQMRWEDYNANVILCGYCEHTSLNEP